MRVRGVRRVVWASVAMLAVAACGSGGGADNASNARTADGVYSYQSVEPQRPLQPANANEIAGGRILENLFRGLYTYDPVDGHPVPAMAQSVTSGDAQHYTVRIKPGWTFHNGEPVTARSFVDAWNWAANAANDQINASWFADIAGYDQVHPASGAPAAATMSGLAVVDPTTFTVTLTAPVSSFRYRLGYIAFSPLPQAFYADPDRFGEHPVGNGPYQLSGNWHHRVDLKLTTYPGYRGEDRPRNGGVDFRFYTTSEAAYTDLLAGRLDVMDQVPPSARSQYKSDLHQRAVERPMAGIESIGVALYDPGWNGRNGADLRAGVSMAIDRATITATVLKHSRIPADSFVAPGVAGYQPGVCGEHCQYHPDQARQLVARAGGVPNNRMTILYNGDGGNREWADAVCNSIRQTLHTECVGAPKPTFDESRGMITSRQVRGGLFRMSWQADYPLSVNFLSDVFRTGAAANDTGYASPRFDSLLAAAEASPDIHRARELYTQAERVLAQDMPAIPLWYYAATTGYSRHVDNVRFGWNGNPDFTGIVVR